MPPRDEPSFHAFEALHILFLSGVVGFQLINLELSCWEDNKNLQITFMIAYIPWSEVDFKHTQVNVKQDRKMTKKK